MGNPNPGSLPECRLIILTKYNLTKYNRLLSVFSYVTVCRTKWILQQERAHVSSLLERCQCFPYEDVCLIFALGSVSRNTVPWAIFPNTLPREQEVYCIRAPPKRGRYWEIHPRRPRDFLRPERFPEGEASRVGVSRDRRLLWTTIIPVATRTRDLSITFHYIAFKAFFWDSFTPKSVSHHWKGTS